MNRLQQTRGMILLAAMLALSACSRNHLTQFDEECSATYPTGSEQWKQCRLDLYRTTLAAPQVNQRVVVQ
jgi:hypothetical protein